MTQQNLNNSNQTEITIKQNPPIKRIETHPIHQKLIIRDMKTGRFAEKR
ncbi:hypothetical protein Calhy_0763 [Caldicellulosiruptor hydrothermalis 108]|uniref:Uncharacterized protein n=1 Tax=Caldicellulosiruptor hydrothermalis (strain DSM 18901 / VKM B-2411 / 108) TaxID=632292 RepID=E4QDT3_CALH1|nr:hypothetical protein Calhy_0763 [Caldicellulosiruptor hydrothermalis 108]